MNTRFSIRRLSLLTLAGLLLISMWHVQPSQGAVPQLDSIRVAIFLQFPGKYQVNTAAATLSSAGGLSIGVKQPSGAEEWLRESGNVQARFAKDDYKVKVLETTSFETALSAYKRVQTAMGSGFITSLTKKSKTVYQVTEGTYKTVDEAKTALSKWKTDSELTKLAGGSQPELQGPLHLESTGYASKAAADKAAEAFEAAGIDTYIAVRKPASGLRYSVMVGAAASSADLDLIKVATGAAGISLLQADVKTPYLLLKSDHTLTGKAGSPLTMYTFPVTSAKVWVEPAGKETIKLTERYSRTYRGAFEFSDFNGKLAVVNELPFEQYLYSVVGAEMVSSWPQEALKAQAVAARTYALYQGSGFQIAHVVDSVSSQAYAGTSTEKQSTIQAVDATQGEVVLYKGKLIEALYSSNGGGATADAKEVWGNAVPYLTSVKSPTDSSAEKGLFSWYRVVLPSGLTGYIREDLLTATSETNPAGIKLMKVNTDGVKVRKIPLIQDDVPLVGQVNSGAKVVVLEKSVQSGPMSWVRGPFSSEELVASLKSVTTISGPIHSLQVSKTGQSGRATELLANGKKLEVKYPDMLRTALGSLPSTLFQIDETARVTVIGANKKTTTKPESAGAVYTVGAGGEVKQMDAKLYIMGSKGQVREATKTPSFRFVGTGFGHGIGLSQYGALGLAEQGYDYSYILKYYYNDVTIAKE
ncbi:SpoIID/LytB domain-containing protein [Paenibacillus sp. FSL H8-0537]|uniref:SpoIID/LytB domain-containing protein n=1 Tax=Paenibacillus sp. FSL H8-0537 TaxID=2921399 RepID=UPI003101ACAF